MPRKSWRWCGAPEAMRIFSPLYRRTMAWSRHRHAQWYLDRTAGRKIANLKTLEFLAH